MTTRSLRVIKPEEGSSFYGLMLVVVVVRYYELGTSVLMYFYVEVSQCEVRLSFLVYFRRCKVRWNVFKLSYAYPYAYSIQNVSMHGDINDMK